MLDDNELFLPERKSVIDPVLSKLKVDRYECIFEIEKVNDVCVSWRFQLHSLTRSFENGKRKIGVLCKKKNLMTAMKVSDPEYLVGLRIKMRVSDNDLLDAEDDFVRRNLIDE